MSERPTTPWSRLEFQRQNFWVGLFVLAALAVFVAVALFAAQERLLRREYSLNASFPRIEGLRPGSDVRIRGYPVGRVTRISFVTAPKIRFDVEFAVEEQLRLPAGTRVRLSTSGFANQVLDLVTPDDATDPEAKTTGPSARRPVFLQPGATVPSAAGTSLDSLFTDALSLTRTLSTTIRNVDSMLTERVGPSLETTLVTITRDLDALVPLMSDALEEARTVLHRTDAAIAENSPRAAKRLDSANAEVKTVGDLARRADRVLASFEDRIDPLLATMTSSLEEMDGFLSRTEDSWSEEDIRRIVDNVKVFTEDTKHLIRELRKRPWRLIRRTKGEKKNLLEQLEDQNRIEETLEAQQNTEAP
jgi:phospholipid/cholesterol/gamma-HCH transport system substrate-binding protein